MDPIVIGAGLSIVTQLMKWIVGRFGKEVAMAGIYVFLFVVSLGWAVVTKTNFISVETVQLIISIVGTAVLTYELILKKLSGMFSK